jgi:Fur family ferric uptake transcriptional regulator
MSQVHPIRSRLRRSTSIRLAVTEATGDLEHAAAIDKVVTAIRARGGKATRCRIALLDVLFSADRPLSAVELASEARARTGRVDRSTAYRNIDQPVDLGVINRLHPVDGSVRFRVATGMYGRFVCDRCGSSTPLPDALARHLVREASRTAGFTVEIGDVSFRGRCGQCRPGPEADAGI